MLRLLLLSLFLTVTALKEYPYETPEGSADDDDELDEELDETSSGTGFLKNEGSQEKSSADDDGTTTIIIIAAVSVVALAIIAVLAVLLFRRHLKNREQGVYAVPAEQGQKAAI